VVLLLRLDWGLRVAVVHYCHAYVKVLHRFVEPQRQWASVVTWTRWFGMESGFVSADLG